MGSAVFARNRFASPVLLSEALCCCIGCNNLTYSLPGHRCRLFRKISGPGAGAYAHRSISNDRPEGTWVRFGLELKVSFSRCLEDPLWSRAPLTTPEMASLFGKACFVAEAKSEIRRELQRPLSSAGAPAVLHRFASERNCCSRHPSSQQHPRYFAARCKIHWHPWGGDGG